MGACTNIQSDSVRGSKPQFVVQQPIAHILRQTCRHGLEPDGYLKSELKLIVSHIERPTEECIDTWNSTQIFRK